MSMNNQASCIHCGRKIWGEPNFANLDDAYWTHEVNGSDHCPVPGGMDLIAKPKPGTVVFGLGDNRYETLSQRLKNAFTRTEMEA